MEKTDYPNYNKFPDIWEIEGVMISFPNPFKPGCIERDCKHQNFDLPFIIPSSSLSFYKQKAKKDNSNSDQSNNYMYSSNTCKQLSLTEILEKEEADLKVLEDEASYDDDYESDDGGYCDCEDCVNYKNRHKIDKQTDLNTSLQNLRIRKNMVRNLPTYYKILVKGKVKEYHPAIHNKENLPEFSKTERIYQIYVFQSSNLYEKLHIWFMNPMKKQAKLMKESEFPISLKISNDEPFVYNFRQMYCYEKFESYLNKQKGTRIPVRIEGEGKIEINYINTCTECNYKFTSQHNLKQSDHAKFCQRMKKVRDMTYRTRKHWKEPALSAEVTREFGVNPYKLKKFGRLNSDEQEEVREKRVTSKLVRFHHNIFDEQSDEIESEQLKHFYNAAKENYMFIKG